MTDKVAKGEVVIEHKPTKEMWIDVNTKPNQGTPFKIDRGYLMNCPINVPDETLALPRKEGFTSEATTLSWTPQEYVGSTLLEYS